MRPLVLGTAGHIDHGKTTLVRALTGTDTDRLPDEKRRGITIDLGFAQLVLPDGTRLGIVDVPGHEAFVRNMLAGATGIDVVMLVVASDEGPMPQTREHLGILDLLGVTHGVVALTRTDLVEPEWLELVRDEVRDVLAPTGMRDAPIIDVSATTGAGLDRLRSALSDMAANAVRRSDADAFRMPLDRAFTVHGTGTVVTGTVWSGSLRRDDHVRLLPSGITARVRGLQQHGVACDEVHAGSRAAIALAGVDRDAMSRGDTLVTGTACAASGILTVELRLLHDAPAPIRTRQRVRVHVGTAEVLGRVALLSTSELLPGGSAIAQLRLESPIVVRAGDRFVVRSYSPVHTIAGGIVLEPVPPKRKRLSGGIAEALDIVAAAHGPGSATAARTDSADTDLLDASVMLAGISGLDVALVPLVTGLPPHRAEMAIRACGSIALVGDRLLPAVPLRLLEERLLTAIAAFHRARPLLDGIERETLRRDLGDPPLLDDGIATLLDGGRAVAAGNMLALPGHAAVPMGEAADAMARIAAVYDAAGLEPPELTQLPPDLARRDDLLLLARFLERDGTLIRLAAGRLISARAVSEAVIAVRAQTVQGQSVDISHFREILKLSRRHLIPLLEHLDRTGVTRREGEARVVLPA